MSTLFVTATGTEIGKTLVTAALCHELRVAGRPVRALKPVLSGYDPATLAESDPGILLASLGEAVTEEAVAAIAPWRFAAPLSPDMAAAREGRRLDLAAILAFCRAAEGDPLLIEGIGGAMVPLDDDHTVLDWISAELGAPALVVAGQLPRHHQPHAHHARSHTRARRPHRRTRHQRVPGKPGAAPPRRRRPSRGTPGRCPSRSCRVSPPAPLPGARHRRSQAHWASWTAEGPQESVIGPSPARHRIWLQVFAVHRHTDCRPHQPRHDFRTYALAYALYDIPAY